MSSSTNPTTYQITHDGSILHDVIGRLIKTDNDKFFCQPEDFGAAGDGITNDTEAMKDAISSGKLVVLLKSYLVDGGELNLVDKRASILGCGMHTSRIIQRDGTQGATLTIKDTCSLIRLENFGVYGTGAQQGSGFTANTMGIFVETPTGLSGNYPFNNTSDPRRDLIIDGVHVAGQGDYGIYISDGNFSVTLSDVLVQHQGGTGIYCATTDWTWINTQVNTCKLHCVHLKGAGNARIVGGKFIWGCWENPVPHAGLMLEDCQNLDFSAVEVQDCGADGIYFKGCRTISFSGLNTNRNGINSDLSYNNLVFESSDVTISGFKGLNYASNNGSGYNSTAANFRFITSDCSVTIDGIVEAEYLGITFEGDNRLLQPTTADLIINRIIPYKKSSLSIQTVTPTFVGVSSTPVFVSMPPSIGGSGLRLSQANRDQLQYSSTVGINGITLAATIVPTFTGDETFNIFTIGQGFGAGNNSLYFQLIKSGATQSVALLLSGDGTSQVLSGDIPDGMKLVSGVPYHFALGATGGRFWWSIMNVETGRVVRRAFRAPYLSAPFNSIFGSNLPFTIFSGRELGAASCSGIGAHVYAGSFSSESDYVATRYYGLTDPIDMNKMFSYRTLNGAI